MTAESKTAAAARGAVRIWTEEEKDLVWEETLKAKEENLPLTEAFRRCAKLLPHRSEAAVGMLYYNVLRKERQEPPPKPKPPTAKPTAEFTVDPRLLEAFQGLPEYMQDLNDKVRSLEERLASPDPLAILKALGSLAGSLNNQDEMDGRLKQLEEENAQLRETVAELQKSLADLKAAYDDALGIYDMFTNMASISQIMSLGDFKQQMKTTLDKWGNVLNVTFARSV
ncbi:MAG TPA: hypothetical protein GX014_01320 [Firmicutes bacterium]|mgnify:CR=1 FL=1|jgi:chromosome segregation ATPase|nr:hypothetical protein [Bacillota bacterium]HHT42030.1 hypothetical protein [Bacillota bacterium]